MKRWLIGLLLVPSIVWLISVPLETFSQMTFWSGRQDFIVLTGILAYALMAWVMVLAIRPSWLEQRVGGLDRAYWLHKWCGIGAAVLVFAHWMIEIIPKNMVKVGWLVRPSRPPKGGGGAEESFLHGLIDLAKDFGEWVGYIGLALIVIALLKRIPYQWFRKVHKLFPVLFLLVTFHAVILTPVGLWLTPTGLLIASCALFGSIAAVISLAGWIGRSRRVKGTVMQVNRLGRVLEVTCQLADEGLKYRAGQFAYLRFVGSHDAHPFTIASFDSSKLLRFYIKVLGDDTNRMFETLQKNCEVVVEGPYGRFDFAGKQKAEQIWIAGGIGVTPFIARLEYLAKHPDTRPNDEELHFFFCTVADDPMLLKLKALCSQVGVQLHIIIREVDGGMTFDKVLAKIKNPNQAGLWFCGPRGLGDKLENGWRRSGLSQTAFHREIFEMR